MLTNIKLLPDKSKDYPLRFFFYWLIIWAVLFLYSTVIMIPKISSNGFVVRKDVCIDEGSTGRFDEYTKCYEYGTPKYVPVGEELVVNFKKYGLISFFVTFIIGWILWNGAKIEEQKEKIDIYEFPRHNGEKIKITVGHNNIVKADIYWEDIIDSKNNINTIHDESGNKLIDSNFHPEDASNFVNKACPKCKGVVNRFYFRSSKNREFDHGAWMEVCFKCKKIIYLDVDFKE